MTEQEGFIEAIADRDERIKNMTEIYEALTAERDHWLAQHKECTRLLGEALQEAADMTAERDALKAKNTALLEALNQVMSWIDNWSPEFSYDPEWPKDRDSARAAIAKATGEKK